MLVFSPYGTVPIFKGKILVRKKLWGVQTEGQSLSPVEKISSDNTKWNRLNSLKNQVKFLF
jgi:hypothetical protein